MLFAEATPAMEIIKFDRMAVADQSNYMVVLVEGAQKVLIDSGHSDMTEKVPKLFTEIKLGECTTNLDPSYR